MEKIVLIHEATEEAQRLSRVHGRSVEIKAVECCEYDKSCGCGGMGLSYQLVFASCDHLADDLGICEQEFCAERELAKRAFDVETFPVEHKPLQSLRESLSEREEAVA